VHKDKFNILHTTVYMVAFWHRIWKNWALHCFWDLLYMASININ